MGREFVRQLAERYPVLDEIWAVARREERLLELQKETGNVRIRAFSLDLKDEESFQKIAESLRKENPRVGILVNGSGIGISGDFMNLSEQEISDMVAVNCGALTKMTYLVLPYMKKGARIYQFASAGICGLCGSEGVRSEVFDCTPAGAEEEGNPGNGSLPGTGKDGIP